MTAGRAADFGPLADVYAPLERVTFGGALSRRRLCFLGEPALAHARRALVLGDGDGRFSAALLAKYPDIELTVVDASRRMLVHLEARVRRRSPTARIEIHCADAREWSPGPGAYDLVATHFFFDCFSTPEVDAIVARIAPALSSTALWLVSDFAVPRERYRAALARVLIRALYFAFRLLTGLENSRLPDHAAALVRHALVQARAERGLGGILRSELWTRADLGAQAKEAAR